jgi:hypothetical protein
MENSNSRSHPAEKKSSSQKDKKPENSTENSNPPLPTPFGRGAPPRGGRGGHRGGMRGAHGRKDKSLMKTKI